MATAHGCHLAPFMMNIYDAKFEEYRSNILRDTFDSVQLTVNGVIAFLICINNI